MAQNRYAVPLYLQAISLLIPSTSSKDGSVIPPENRCRGIVAPYQISHTYYLLTDYFAILPGAMLMNNLSSLFLSSNANVAQARAWATKALEVTEKAREGTRNPEPVPECESVIAAVLFNLGMLSEV